MFPSLQLLCARTIVYDLQEVKSSDDDKNTKFIYNGIELQECVSLHMAGKILREYKNRCFVCFKLDEQGYYGRTISEKIGAISFALDQTVEDVKRVAFDLWQLCYQKRRPGSPLRPVMHVDVFHNGTRLDGQAPLSSYFSSHETVMIEPAYRPVVYV